MDELIEVSGSCGGSKPDRSAAAAYESFDNMGKEKEEEIEELSESDLWGSDAGSDDDEEEEEVCEDPMEPDCEGPMEPDCDCEDPMDPDCEDPDCEDTDSEDPDCEDPRELIWHLIYMDDSIGLMELLNLPKDGICQKDPHYDYEKLKYEKLKYAFRSATYLNKLECLKALLYSGVDWFAEALGAERLLHHTILADTKNAAKLVIAYAKKNNSVDKLLGAIDEMGLTPLHLAASCGSCNVIQLLLDEGADPCKRDANRKLPSDYAIPRTKAWNVLVDAVLKKL